MGALSVSRRRSRGLRKTPQWSAARRVGPRYGPAVPSRWRDRPNRKAGQRVRRSAPANFGAPLPSFGIAKGSKPTIWNGQPAGMRRAATLPHATTHRRQDEAPSAATGAATPGNPVHRQERPSTCSIPAGDDVAMALRFSSAMRRRMASGPLPITSDPGVPGRLVKFRLLPDCRATLRPGDRRFRSGVPSRRQHAVERVGHEPGKAKLQHGRHIGHVVPALRAGDGERAHGPVHDARMGARQRGAHQRLSCCPARSGLVNSKQSGNHPGFSQFGCPPM